MNMKNTKHSVPNLFTSISLAANGSEIICIEIFLRNILRWIFVAHRESENQSNPLLIRIDFKNDMRNDAFIISYVNLINSEICLQEIIVPILLHG